MIFQFLSFILPDGFAVTIGAIGSLFAIVFLLLEFSSGIRTTTIKMRRNRYTHGHATALLYHRLIGPSTVLLRNGALLTAFEVAAPDADAYGPGGLAADDDDLALALNAIDDRMVAHLHIRHERVLEYTRPATISLTPELEWFDEERAKTFNGAKGIGFRSKRIISISWLPLDAQQEKLRSIAMMGDGQQAVKSMKEIVDEFEEKLLKITSVFSSIGVVKRLGEISEPDEYGIIRNRSSLLEHIAFCISGRNQKINVPHPAVLLNGLLAQPFRGGYDLKIGDYETRVVVVKNFPNATIPLALKKLSDLGINYSLVVRLLPMSAADTLKRLKSSSTEWQAKATESTHTPNLHAKAMLDSSLNAIAHLNSGIAFANTSVLVILRSQDVAEVERGVRLVMETMDSAGYPSIRATMTAEDDYFASLPGDGYHGIRKFPLMTPNITRIFSFHEESPGRRFLSSPTVPNPQHPSFAYGLNGPGDTLYRLNLNTDPSDVFHHLGIGGTGLGKSVSIGTIAAHWMSRIPNAGFTGIDRGRSMFRLCRFLNGNYYELLGENSPGIALFSDIEDEQYKRELIDLLEGFCSIQGVHVSSERRERLEEAMQSMFQFQREHRSLTAYCQVLQDPDRVLRPALHRYTRKGVLGMTLDCEQDTFTTGRFNVIEIGKAMGLESKYLAPLLRAIFWKAQNQVRILKRTTGNYDYHWLFEIDEAHTLLKHELGQKFILDFLKMGRKERNYLGIWTNSIDDIVHCPILTDILEACKTRFYFRNTEVADSDNLFSAYQAMGLPDHAINAMGNIPKHTMLIHQPSVYELVLFKWVLSKAALSVVGRTNEADNVRLAALIQQYPDCWREKMFEADGLDAATINRYRELLDEYRRKIIPAKVLEKQSLTLIGKV